MSAIGGPFSPRRSASRRVVLVDVALADLDDVAVRVGDPDRAPARDERVEVHRAGGHLRVGAHLSELGVDVVDLEREMAPARVLGAGSRGAGAGSGCVARNSSR